MFHRNEVDWMKVNRTYSIDASLVQALRSKRNQSATVCKALRLYLSGEDEFSISNLPLRQVMAALSSRKDCPDGLKALLHVELTRELPGKQKAI